ncbi:MAG: DUF2789 domain-containing protein [Halothiobacillaceae bacterium]|jgi:hypothetical protein|nr:DUF2789 domain-containing protein [Halothiobacillaceae bacterium]MDY0050523.1 DUF2789 domain-containing protein [Halothiobacillaceae bacterium]
MNSNFHPLSELFAQLGLPDNEEAIERFIETHRPLPHNMLLSDAPFWRPAQAAFLREAVADDGDWAEIADQFDARLR